MASVTITVPNAQLARTLAGICGFHKYSSTLRDGSPNPETQAAFVQRMLANIAKQWVAAYEAQVASDTATASVQTDITPS